MLCTTSNHPIAAADTQPLLLMLVHRPNAEKLHKPSPAILTLGLEPASESACAIAVVLPSRKHANWVRDNAYAGCVFSVTLPTTGASPNHPPPTSATPNPFLDAAPGTLVDPPTPTCLGLYLRTLRADAVLRLVREGDPMVEEHGGFRDTVEGWWVAGWNDGYVYTLFIISCHQHHDWTLHLTSTVHTSPKKNPQPPSTKQHQTSSPPSSGSANRASRRARERGSWRLWMR
ncbi:uncharacterized protein EV422DRAFT_536223 [Fimicolochytrium jonesii]|uniref:uncharacterized protein n=1 Tax=Fimicolochytrium jonesii TaxID=1396493 RepID=UPI0022FDD27F|nr:uncharacterized protein EV422DRAFT_536223 [Fimicolochytrium jonesii]KAI8818988.1 hypothetical protein EV422DRAFT_536223 [Fimicolochytrium jonesii]